MSDWLAEFLRETKRKRGKGKQFSRGWEDVDEGTLTKEVRPADDIPQTIMDAYKESRDED